MRIYNYHPLTGVYLGESDADPNPLEPDAPIIPAFATTIAPPTCNSGEQAVFAGDAWHVEAIPAQPEPPEPSLAEVKAAMQAEVDNHIGGIYVRFTRFESEYVEREAAARAYVAAGYTGDPTIWVHSFATSTGRTDSQAADLIIAQANALRAALVSLGAQRMRKYLIASAADEAAASALRDDIIDQADFIVKDL